ncbi:feline leukemia virus subgroup C receptor-related protein 2-like protein [Dinothrombium tinctorium]|uniref:Feline leukemia virus subgroup C receptor-related protein 2-like protein n=1 Tax=Dinothrombium tinctorium TaxID=1965070 RepID=A0A443QGS9_9ACAR|nr:feline leukemia virus subgroup C receptor-related protein 2-like protein [Dinothrombium tinctorium]
MQRNRESSDDEGEYKVYSRRYFLLCLYSCFTFLIGFQQLEYTSITNVVTKYYNVDSVAVNWTNILQNLCTALFSFFIGKLTEKYGFRKSMITFTFLGIIGAVIKCFAIDRSLFWLLMVGQFFPCIFFTPTFSLSSLLGALWFKPKEIALVIGMGNAAITFGMAVTFLLPSLVFKSDSINEIKYNLAYVSVILMLLEATIFLLTLIFVTEKPPTPPSLAEETRTNIEIPKIINLMRNKNFLLPIMCFAFGCASVQLISITLNQSILSRFSNGNTVLSVSGVLLMITAIPGSLLIGTVSKAYPRYKLLLIIVCFISVTFQVLFLLSLWIKCDWLLYVSIFLFGVFVNASQVLALDFVLEVSFPFPENLSFAISFTAFSLPNLILVPLATILCKKVGAVNANFVFLALGIMTLVSALLAKEDLRRRKANAEMTPLLAS